MSKVVHRKKRLSSFKLIVLGFAAVIFVGALLLMLPVSSVSGTQTPFHEALFTSVSAVCVTGLVVQDTGRKFRSCSAVQCRMQFLHRKSAVLSA